MGKKKWKKESRNALITRDSFNIKFLKNLKVKEIFSRNALITRDSFNKSWGAMLPKGGLRRNALITRDSFNGEKTCFPQVLPEESQCPHNSGQFQLVIQL